MSARPSLAAIAGLAALALRCGGEGTAEAPSPPLGPPGPPPAGLVVVPTLDTPIPAGTSAIWCAAFPLAWARLKSDVVRGAVRLKDADELSDRLDRAADAAAAVIPTRTVALAGLAGAGIADRIASAVRATFPGTTPPRLEFADDANTLVTWARLEAHVPFTHGFATYDDPIEFTGSDRKTVGVLAFGLRPEDEEKRQELRTQVAVLFAETPEDEPGSPEFVAFAVDLCRTSSPDQVIVARLPGSETLAATLADRDRRIAGTRRAVPSAGLDMYDTLGIPEIVCAVESHFTEIEGRSLATAGFEQYRMVRATQQLTFRLDRGGAQVGAEAVGEAFLCAAPAYFADGPFLVTVGRRGAPGPYLVCWVANDTLLQRR